MLYIIYNMNFEINTNGVEFNLNEFVTLSVNINHNFLRSIL